MNFISFFTDCEVTFLLLEISDSRTILCPSSLLLPSSIKEANLEKKSIMEELCDTPCTLPLLLHFSVLDCEADENIIVRSGLIRLMT